MPGLKPIGSRRTHEERNKVQTPSRGAGQFDVFLGSQVSLLVIEGMMVVSEVLHALVSPPKAQKRWRAFSQRGALFGEIKPFQIEAARCQAMIL